MTAAERLDEIADILAAGLIRLSARKSSAFIYRPRRKFARLLARPERSIGRSGLGGGCLMTDYGTGPRGGAEDHADARA